MPLGGTGGAAKIKSVRRYNSVKSILKNSDGGLEEGPKRILQAVAR